MLDPFSETEVADYVAQRSASLARDEAFVRALHERTDGVPLFVSSVISEVMDRTDDEATIEARLAAMWRVPENLAAIIDHYIARLGQEQRALLSAAAVCGVEFRVETLSLVLERDVASVAHACEELVREQVWLMPSRAADDDEAGELPYSFRHALFRQVLYDRTPPVGAHPAASPGRCCPRTRALGRRAGRRGGVGDALRPRATADDRAALLRRGGGSRAAALQPGRMHRAHRARVGPVAAGAGRAERDALEITLATLQGVSAFHSLGVGSKARDAFERAYVLLANVPEHPMRGRLLHGFGYLLSLRGDYAQALAVAERAEALSSGADDPALMLAACIVHGEVHHLQGRRRRRARGSSADSPIAESLDFAANEMFAADPQVTLLGMLAIELVRCGLLRQARAQMQRAQTRAPELRQPMTQLVASWQEALLEVRLGNTERVATLADEMQALVDEFSLGQGRTACQWFRGWADAWKGEPREGYRRIREAYEENTRLGMRSGASEVLGYAAQALLLAGDIDAAQAELDAALQVAQELAERVYLPQLLLLEAAIAWARGQTDAGAASARRAIEEARTQEASWLELLALVELCEHHAATAEERGAVRTLVGRLPEAHDTPLLGRARELIESVEPD